MKRNSYNDVQSILQKYKIENEQSFKLIAVRKRRYYLFSFQAGSFKIFINNNVFKMFLNVISKEDLLILPAAILQFRTSTLKPVLNSSSEGAWINK